MPSHLLLLNFGSFQETHRFKTAGLAGGFLPADAMETHPPQDLVMPDGVRLLSVAGEQDVYTLLHVGEARWTQGVGPNAYRRIFGRWVGRLAGADVSIIYLTGHQRTFDGEAEFDSEHFGIGFRVPQPSSTNSPEFFSFLVDDDADFGYAQEVTTPRPANGIACRVLVGVGCNLATQNGADFYQHFFATTDVTPIVLGWRSLIRVPRATWPSVNEGFFEALAAEREDLGEGHETRSLTWMAEHEPKRVIRAWGQAAYAYARREGERREQAQRRFLWLQSTAQDADGNRWRFRAPLPGERVRMVQLPRIN